MPELPEVEVVRIGLSGLEGRRIAGAVVRVPRLRHPLDPGLPQRLAGLTLGRIARRGKYLLFDCGKGTLIVHLGMSGNLRLLHRPEPAQKHDHFDLVFAGPGKAQAVLRYADPRRFGTVIWHEAPTATHPLLAPLGIEPLEEGFTAEWLHTALRKRSAPIKQVLMDGHLVVGIGNIYANESLFRAGISPLRPASGISLERCRRLVQRVREVLAEAIAMGGSSVRDYIHSDGGAGCFQLTYAVYGRAGRPCPKCGGAVRQVRQGGRSSFYCPRCQR